MGGLAKRPSGVCLTGAVAGNWANATRVCADLPLLAHGSTMAIGDFEGTTPLLPEEFFNGRRRRLGCGKLGRLQKRSPITAKAIGERVSRQFTSPRSTRFDAGHQDACDGRSASLVEASTVALRHDQLARPSRAAALRLRNDRPLRAASLPKKRDAILAPQIKQIAKSIEAWLHQPNPGQ